MRAGWAIAALCSVVACTGTERAAMRPDRDPATAWRVATGRGELLAALEPLGTGPVVIDVSAQWCMPCVELRTKTLEHARVKTALIDYGRIELDVTEQSNEQLALGDLLGVQALPLVLRFDDAAALRTALAAGRSPTPSMRIGMFVTPDELVAALQR